MKEGKMTEKELEVFNYVKENGGRVSIDEICAATGRNARSIGPNINAFAKEGLAERVKEAGEDGDITFVQLTAEGKAFTPAAE